MRVLAFNFIKISAERKPKIDLTKKISANIEFDNVEKEKLEFMKDSNALKISFNFTINYEPDNAKIILQGVIILGADQDIVKNAIKLWKKKRIDEKMKIPLYNTILDKCTLKAFQLEEQINLPPHIRLPKLGNKKQN